MNLKPSKVIAGVGLAILQFSLFGKAQTPQYVTLLNTNFSLPVRYPVQTNQVVSLVGVYGNPTVSGEFPDGTVMNLPAPSSGQFQEFTGLTNIDLHAGNVVLVATLKITTTQNTAVVSNYVPADAVVVPASATGNVQIILESSPDLVNWTAANPGTYGPSAGTNRFFRVRATLN